MNFFGLWPMPGQTHLRLIAEDISREPGAKPEDEQIDEMLNEVWILPLRDAVQIIWTMPDPRTKQWGIFRILDQAIFEESQALGYGWPFWQRPSSIAFLPPRTAFEQALQYLLRHRTAFCANPDCPAPYFFPTRPKQKYCSEDCALPAQREFKRDWWAKRGKAWRKERASHIRRKK